MSEMKQIPSSFYALFTRRASFKTQTSYTAYEYLDANGKLLGAVGRIVYDNGGKREKDFFQMSWDAPKKKWNAKADNIAGCLFHQNLIATAELVIFVEGEKAATKLQTIVKPGVVVTTLAGGASFYGHGNYTPLRDKEVIIWRDNDDAGRKGAMRAHTAMASAGVKVLGWVAMNKDWPEKADCVDVIEKYGADVAIEALRILESYAPQATENIPAENLAEKYPFEILGRSDQDDVYFYCFQDGAIRMINQKQFDDMTMLQIYNNTGFWENYCGINERSGKPNKANGWAKVWELVLKRGVYEPAQTRYVGVYRDAHPDGTPVYVANTGAFLYVNGQKIAHADYSHNYIYIQDRPTNLNVDQPAMSDFEARQIVAFFEKLQLRTLEQRQLALGWTVASFLSGCLPRRPHLWLYAPALSGKSYILERMEELAHGCAFTMTASSSSYAGVKQHVGSRCYPVLWDESEAQKENQGEKWEKIMEMARVSFDCADGKILQGTKDGSGAFVTPRMMFCFSSIKTADMEESVSSRIIKLDLAKFTLEKTKADHIKECSAMRRQINWQGISSRLFLRVYQNADIFFANHALAYKLFSDMGVDDRRSSSLAVCFAGFLLLSDLRMLTEDEMLDVIWRDPMGLMPINEQEEINLFDLLMGAAIDIDGDAGRSKVSVAQVWRALKDGVKTLPFTSIPTHKAVTEFEQYGLGIEDKKIFVWPKNKRLYRAMGWYKGIESVAPSLPGYSSAEKEIASNNVQGFTFVVDKKKTNV